MAGSSQPQPFFAAGCIFAVFGIALIFYPVKKTLWKFLCISFGCSSTQILNFNVKNNFANMLKIVQKSGFDPIFNIFAKFKIWALPHPNNMH